MKCQNCGAEIGNKKVCEFCGSQITAEMLKEQEIISKSGCPKCGSTNVRFNRENQGEIRGKKSKKVIHTTVGFCNDCGHTWYPNGNSGIKQRKTWLWVLGWIVFFPIPLTIILLKNQKLNPKVKYILIAIAWILGIILIASTRSSNKTVSNDKEQLTSTVISQDEQKNENSIEVILNVTPKVNDEDGTVLFDVETNLPESTKINIAVNNSSGKEIYSDLGESEKVTILNNGHGFTAEYSENGEKLSGEYTVKLSIDNPSLQKAEVKEIIGDNGENMTGEYIISDGKTNRLQAEFTFDF